LGGLLEPHENQKCAQNNWEDMEKKKRKQKLIIGVWLSFSPFIASNMIFKKKERTCDISYYITLGDIHQNVKGQIQNSMVPKSLYLLDG
jgi:hypothetical protein